MGLQQAKLESLPFVTGELNYLAPTPGKPRTYAFDPPPGEPKSTALPEPHQVPIFDARLIANNLSLDREGFALVRHPTSVRNFYDDKEVRNVYYPAAEAFLRATLKADRVVIFDHTVRKRVEGAADVRGAVPRQPATRVHVDQTELSGANRVREHLPDEADELLKGRVQVINLWRPIRGPLRDAPLAMLDGQTVAQGDLIASDLIYPNRQGETYSVKYNPNHRWYYIPEMTVDEALLLKCYDSATDGRTRFGPHTAFIDPTTPADAAPRESIELRTLVFHKHWTLSAGSADSHSRRIGNTPGDPIRDHRSALSDCRRLGGFQSAPPNRGVLAAGYGMMALSTPTTDADIDAIIDAASGALREVSASL